MTCCATGLLTLWPWVFFNEFILASRYPIVDEEIAIVERSLVEESLQRMQPEIRRQYPLDYAYPEDTIVAIGSSQTWGSGAALREDAWTYQLETILNEANSPREHLVVNAGIPGAESHELFRFYEDFMSQYPHKLLVIALGCNDRDANLFYEYLERFVVLARSSGVTPLLVVEALSHENAPEGTKQGWVLQAVAEAYDVPLFDLHNAVAPYQDAGFFWWDIVHPTSFGHACIAKALAPFIQEHL